MANDVKEIDVEQLIKSVMDCAFSVRKHLAQGFEEKVYKNALYLELTDNGIDVKPEVPCDVFYKGQIVGQYRADMIVENQLILELKANQCLTLANEVQLVNYLQATGIDHGLLINFGGERIEFKRKYRVYKTPFK